ncbi:CoA-binding protein [Ruminococcaceae bacterium OttesenSCG-928-D13]|nr:CoA-binding protein [Ruminococcaceae bacterium OttesenSCG-928-D13]
MDTGNNIGYLLDPQSIALLGCSEKNVTGTVLLNLQSAGYAGKIYPVHPRNTEVHGVKCYPSLADVPGEVDACVVGLRSSLVLQAVEEMHQKGVKGAVFPASGFAETGEEGRQLERQLKEKLGEYGIAACGPNCLGLVNTHKNAMLYSAACDLTNVRGRIGLVSHSGSICIAMSSAARGAGFSYLVSCGNEVGLTVADYFRAMLEDENTDILVGFLETIRDPEGLAEVARLAAAKNKPIVILKVGKSEVAQATAAAHSGALASGRNVTDAFFRQNHILQVDNFDELSEFCELWLRLKDQAPPPACKRWPSPPSRAGSWAFAAISPPRRVLPSATSARIPSHASRRPCRILPPLKTRWTSPPPCSTPMTTRSACAPWRPMMT